MNHIFGGGIEIHNGVRGGDIHLGGPSAITQCPVLKLPIGFIVARSPAEGYAFAVCTIIINVRRDTGGKAVAGNAEYNIAAVARSVGTGSSHRCGVGRVRVVAVVIVIQRSVVS